MLTLQSGRSFRYTLSVSDSPKSDMPPNLFKLSVMLAYAIVRNGCQRACMLKLLQPSVVTAQHT
jgi:hypothetical protein